jgi:CheY-like chemotaxis protein
MCTSCNKCLPSGHLAENALCSAVLSLLTNFFRKHGHVISVAADGEGMFAALEKHTIDLIILEVTLRVEDGFSLCRRLRATSTLPVRRARPGASLDEATKTLMRRVLVSSQIDARQRAIGSIAYALVMLRHILDLMRT